MNIEIWSIGKSNETFIEEGIQFYIKRLNPFCKLSYVYINPPKRTKSIPIEQMKRSEEKLILDKLQAHHYLILLDEIGKSYNSRKWAFEIDALKDHSKTIVFLIGGPWGITENIRNVAHKTWSLSALTFPHQLVRLILAEQIYRSFSILNNSGYHHD